MATLAELAGLPDDTRWGDLLGQCRAACVKKATTVVQAGGTEPATRQEWAKNTIADPDGAGAALIWFAVGANADATVDNIFSAADAVIESNINSAVDAIYAS